MSDNQLAASPPAKTADSELVPALGAVLFAGGDPVDLARLCGVFSRGREEILEALERLGRRLEGTGVRLVRTGESYGLVSRKEYAAYVAAAFDQKRRQPLSQAGFEVLAVIAYNQPVTRAFVEQVRGVDCSGVLASLVEKGLIEERGRLELPGRPLLYGTTERFLRCFMLESLEDLPPLPETGEPTGGAPAPPPIADADGADPAPDSGSTVPGFTVTEGGGELEDLPPLPETGEPTGGEPDQKPADNAGGAPEPSGDGSLKPSDGGGPKLAGSTGAPVPTPIADADGADPASGANTGGSSSVPGADPGGPVPAPDSGSTDPGFTVTEGGGE